VNEFDDDEVDTEPLDADWRDESACGFETKNSPFMAGAWDGPNEDGVSHPYAEQATEICIKRCPVRDICLQSALNNPKAQGIRGGYVFDNGRLPVAVAREIRDTMDLVPGPHQSLGKASRNDGEEPRSKYV
jgi:hypothetical protein